MAKWAGNLVARVDEDDGLVAGLAPEAAAVVRRWCLERLNQVKAECGEAAAFVYADRLIAQVRVVTDVVAAVEAGRRAGLAARLGRVLPDGPGALRALEEPRPLEKRIRDVLSQLPYPSSR